MTETGKLAVEWAKAGRTIGFTFGSLAGATAGSASGGLVGSAAGYLIGSFSSEGSDAKQNVGEHDTTVKMACIIGGEQAGHAMAHASSVGQTCAEKVGTASGSACGVVLMAPAALVGGVAGTMVGLWRDAYNCTAPLRGQENASASMPQGTHEKDATEAEQRQCGPDRPDVVKNQAQLHMKRDLPPLQRTEFPQSQHLTDDGLTTLPSDLGRSFSIKHQASHQRATADVRGPCPKVTRASNSKGASRPKLRPLVTQELDD